MNIYSIYKATNLVNGKCYIGFDSNWPQRKKEHKISYKKNSTQILYKAIKKYGWDNFNWEVIYQSKDGTHTLKNMENYFINEHNSFNSGYNMTLGGEGALGCFPSEETRKKLSNSLKGRILTDEWKKKISESCKNKPKKPFTDEHKMKIGMSQKGKILKKIECVNCNRMFILGNHNRWHGNKCKYATKID